MKTKSNFTSVILFGGLGNQLFQLAAGLYFADMNDSPLRVYVPNRLFRDTLVGSEADFEKLKFLRIVSFNRFGSLQYKIFASLLSSGLSREKHKTSIEFSLKKSLATSFFTISNFKKFKLEVSENLGYVEFDQCQNLLVIGYFQSYKYFQKPSVRDRIKGIIFSNSSESSMKLTFKWEDIANIECPLVVHVRRGDYRKESKFGLVGPAYYSKGIKVMLENFDFKKIWLFSDEPNEALSLIPKNLRTQVRILENEGLKVRETLKVMSLGKAFVLANSTFGYWAAQLSGVAENRILVPNPWFKSMDEPRDLINPEWRTLDASWI